MALDEIVGGKEASFVPVRAHFDAAGVVDVAGDMFHTCVLTSSGIGVARVALGRTHACAHYTSGLWKCWGDTTPGRSASTGCGQSASGVSDVLDDDRQRLGENRESFTLRTIPHAIRR